MGSLCPPSVGKRTDALIGGDGGHGVPTLRLAKTHVFNAPEFSDRTQFRSAFEALFHAGRVQLDSAGWVHFEGTLIVQADEAAFLLPADTRAAVLRAAQLRAQPSAASA